MSHAMGVGTTLDDDIAPPQTRDTRSPADTPVPAEADHFASLAATIPGVVYQRVVRPDGDIRYTYLSEGAREIFGVSPDEVLRDPEALFKTYSAEYKAHFRQRLVAASKALTTWDVEASIVTPDGRTRYTHAIAKPQRLADGSVLWTGIILDATRIKMVEEELKAANRSVEAANRAKSLFLANMSHEIRTPMNGVLGMADLLLKTDLNPRQARLVTMLGDSAKTLLAIINDLLDISRIEAGRFQLDSLPFNLRHCIEDALELCAGTGYKKGVEVNLIIADGVPISVKSDPGRLRQVLINLIGNAVKFTQVGEVVVRVSPRVGADGAPSVGFEVSDTGVGIDPAAKSRLFRPFEQADSSISRRFGGTGLGLAITRHLVSLMGGEVDLESEVGHGTTVRFTLPLETVGDAVTPGNQRLVNFDGRRVLVLDDRSTNREVMRANLSGCGGRVEVAENTEQALAMLSAAAAAGDAYALAVADRCRPHSDSLDFGRRARADRRLDETALMLLMSMNFRSDGAVESELSPCTLINKPFRRTDLLTAIAGSLSRRQSAPAAASKPAASAAAVKLPRTGRTRVLLVEDNPVNIELAQEYLAEFGCDIVLAQTGHEAIKAHESMRFDLVLMDCQIPGLDGLTVIRRLREAERLAGTPRVPIVTVTANAYDSDRNDALDAGSDDFLSKPFTDEQLRDALARWTGKAA